MTLKLRLAAFRRHKSSRVGAKAPKAASVTVDAPVYADATLGSLSFVPSSNRTDRCQDRLPTLGYTDDERATPCTTPSLTSSASYASSLTEVDDGLTLWGLPKVMGLMEDEDEYFDCQDFEKCERQRAPVSAPAPAAPASTPTPQQLTAKRTLTVVYTAILARKSAPNRYAQPASSVPVWSMFI